MHHREVLGQKGESLSVKFLEVRPKFLGLRSFEHIGLDRDLGAQSIRIFARHSLVEGEQLLQDGLPYHLSDMDLQLVAYLLH
jgi:ABC-type microcin C transport system permease subunit YejE